MMRIRIIQAFLLVSLACPAAAQAADPAIEAVETSVRLGGIAGYGGFADGSGSESRNERLLGVSAGLSDLSSDRAGFWFPDLYTAAAYNFSYGTWDAGQGWRYPSGSALTLHDNAYDSQAIIRLGAGMPFAGRMELIPYLATGYENWSLHNQRAGGEGQVYQSELLGGGLRLDVATRPNLIVSAAAEGFAMLGGSASEPSQNFIGDVGASAEERVSLDADYRLNQTWHAYAGLGVNHFEYSASRPAGNTSGVTTGAALQIDSMFGIGYGF